MFSHRVFRVRAAYTSGSSWRAMSLPMLSVLLLLSAAPSVAEAQFGKLKDLGSKVAKDAARDAAIRKTAEAVGVETGTGSSAGASTGSSSSRVSYDITAERLDAVLAALAPMMEDARKRAATRQMLDTFTTKRTAFEDCVRTATSRVTSVSAEAVERANVYNEKVVPMVERYTQLSQRPDRRRDAILLQDSLAVLSLQAQLAMAGAKCGPPVYRTVAVADAELEADQSSGTGQWQVPQDKRAGMNASQFGRLRERIALWALIQEGDAKATEGRFSDNEAQALQARAGELKALAPFFRDGTLAWTHWGDIKSW